MSNVGPCRRQPSRGWREKHVFQSPWFLLLMLQMRHRNSSNCRKVGRVLGHVLWAGESLPHVKGSRSAEHEDDFLQSSPRGPRIPLDMTEQVAQVQEGTRVDLPPWKLKLTESTSDPQQWLLILRHFFISIIAQNNGSKWNLEHAKGQSRSVHPMFGMKDSNVRIVLRGITRSCDCHCQSDFIDRKKYPILFSELPFSLRMRENSSNMQNEVVPWKSSAWWMVFL